MAISSCNQILNINAHNDVFTACKEFEAKWKEIGLKLGIGTGKLDAIDLNERECGRCMFQMTAEWLRRISVEQPYPTWRGLYLAIASVDRIAAQRIAREHPCDCSYCTGIDPAEEEKLMFLPQMCECGECTVIDWMEKRFCSSRSIDHFPKFILLRQPSPELSALLKNNHDHNIALQAETEEVIEKYKSLCFLTMEKLNCEVNGFLISRQRWMPLAIEEIVRFLQNWLGLCVPQEIVSFHQLINYLQSIRVSWFNFKPIALISKVYLNGLYPELQKKWIEYFNLFYKYCYQRNLKDCARILFNSENDNTFILQVDETYHDMKLSDISCLRDSLCYVLGCNELSIHLITISRSSLLLVFCYCFEDYLSRFQLTSEQLICLADLKICRILSLKDIRSCFVYPNIQKYKIISHKIGIRDSEHTSQALQFVQKSRRSVIELFNLDVTESLLQGVHPTVLSLKKVSVIDTLSLEVTERQFRLLHPVSSETQKTDMSKTELHVGKEDISPDKYEIQHEELSSVTVQESDSIQHALNSINTQDFRFPLGMNPSKLLINDIESLQKGMDVKELGMTRELQAKEIQTKTFQTIVGDSDEALYSKEFFPEATDEHKEENTDRVKILLEVVESYVISKINELLKSEVQKKKGLKSKQTNEKKMSKEVDIQLNLVTVGVSDEALYSKEVFPEATDEHKGEDSDKVEILLEEVKSYQEIVISKDSEINELKSELQKQKDQIEQLKSKLTSEKKKSKEVDIQSDFTSGLKIELQKQKDIKSQEQFKKKANRVKRSILKEKYGQDIGQFRETTGNVAAIDFSTTFCSLAYTTGSEEQSVANIKLNEVHSRVPTAILLFQKQYRLPDDSDNPVPKSMAYEVKAFGYQAQEEHRKLHSHDRSKCLYFELFRMNLQRVKGVNRNMAMKASNGTECYLVEVIAFILCYLKKELQKHLALALPGNDAMLTTDDFDWVIAVPAIWKSRGKLMMREAAYMAGLCSNENTIDRFIKVGRGVPRPKENNPDRLSLVLKSDATAIFCQTMGLQNVKSYCNVSGSLRSNRYVVISIDGRTIDHRYQDGTHIEVISEWVGSDSGGMKVNNEFSKLLQKIFQDESSDPNDTISFPRYLQSDDPSILALRHDVINSLLHKEFERQKVSFGSNAKGTEPLSQADEQSDAEKEINVKLPFELIDFYGLDKIEEGVEALQDDRIQLAGHVLYIKYSKMREIFQPAVDGILSCIASLLERLQGEIDTIYLVDGFGGCNYVYQKISSLNKNILEENNIRIIVPKNHSLVVSQGAVIYRLNPDIIHSRVMDASYGTDICAPYYGYHNPKYFIGTDSCGIPRRRDVFLYYVEKGEVISSDEVVTSELMPLSDAATQMKIDLYSTYDKDVEYIKDEDENPIPSVRKIGEIRIEIPNEDGLPREKRAVELTMDFSHTEIQVRARYILNNVQVKATIDFLTDHT